MGYKLFRRTVGHRRHPGETRHGQRARLHVIQLEPLVNEAGLVGKLTPARLAQHTKPRCQLRLAAFRCLARHGLLDHQRPIADLEPQQAGLTYDHYQQRAAQVTHGAVVLGGQILQHSLGMLDQQQREMPQLIVSRRRHSIEQRRRLALQGRQQASRGGYRRFGTQIGGGELPAPSATTKAGRG